MNSIKENAISFQGESLMNFRVGIFDSWEQAVVNNACLFLLALHRFF